MDAQSVDMDRKDKVSEMQKWMAVHTHDINAKTAKKYAKALYDSGVPSMEKLAKKLKKNAKFLQAKVKDVDVDDANELKAALSKVFNVSFGTDDTLVVVSAALSPSPSDSEALTAGATAAEEQAETAEMAAAVARYEHQVPSHIISQDRKEKTEAMIEWMKLATSDIILPNVIVYAYRLYDDNCATVNRLASKLERDPDYLTKLGIHVDDAHEIIVSLKNAGLLRADFQHNLSEHVFSIVNGDSRKSGGGGGDADQTSSSSPTHHHSLDAEHVTMLDVFPLSQSQSPIEWGTDVVGLFVGIYSEDIRAWLEGVVIHYNPDSKCHDVRFIDDFELDVDLSTLRIRIQETDFTREKAPKCAQLRHLKSRYTNE